MSYWSVCLCDCTSPCEERLRESGREQVVSDFHDQPVVDRRAILTHCHFVFVWLYSQSTEACSHTSICAMPHRAKYLQCSEQCGFALLPLCNTQDSTQTDKLKCTHTRVHTLINIHMQIHTSAGLKETAAVHLLHMRDHEWKFSVIIDSSICTMHYILIKVALTGSTVTYATVTD